MIKTSLHQLRCKDVFLSSNGMEKDGDAIPDPSEQPNIDTETATGFIVSPVTVFPLDNQKLKTNVTLPAWLKSEAGASNINFSKVLESALIDVLHLNRKVQ